MQFRCYMCGCVFSDGMPPIEALTDQQAGAIGFNEDMTEEVMRSMKSRTLDGTKFEGMSSAGFCEFCLLMIHEFPSAMEGTTYSEEGCPEHVDRHAFGNRFPRYTKARVLYASGVGMGFHPLIDMLASLLFVGIEFEEGFCGHPGCGISLGWRYPHRWNSPRCPGHTFNMRRPWGEWWMYEFHLVFNPAHHYNVTADICDTCAHRWTLEAEMHHEFGPEDDGYGAYGSEDMEDIKDEILRDQEREDRAEEARFGPLVQCQDCQTWHRQQKVCHYCDYLRRTEGQDPF